VTAAPPFEAPSLKVNLMTVSEVVVGSFARFNGGSGRSLMNAPSPETT